MLSLVPTPIGNLKDITLRALETLQEADLIVCEDSRRTGLLLSHFQIKKPMTVLNDFNEARVVPGLITKLQEGQNLALVSDAGTPLIGDPGFKLVRSCFEGNIPVDSLPGPSSVTTALTLSGLPPQRFVFLHYLPEKPKARHDMLQTIKNNWGSLNLTFIVFVSPHKLATTLNDILTIVGNIQVTLVKELTKVHQTVKKEFLSGLVDEFKSKKPKGEYILMFHLNTED